MILGGNAGFLQRRHLDRVLGIGKALKPAFTQRVEGDDFHAPLPHLAQVMQHPGRIGPDILAEEEDRIAIIEILLPGRANSLADRSLQAHRSRFMAHV